MLPELDARLARMDRRFDSIDERLEAVDRRFDAVDERLDAIDRRFEAVDRRFDVIDQRFEAVDRRFDRLETQIVTTGEETRRHFEVIAESLMSRIELVAEGVLTVDRKVDRLAEEMRGEITRVKRRIVTLSARLPPKRRR